MFPRARRRTFRATAVDESSIRLSWTAPSDDGGASIIGYRIEVSLTGTAGWSTLESNSRSTSTSYTHSGLLPGSKRYYRVAAINSEGTGTLSRVAHATTRAVLPGAPTNLTATARGTTRIDLVWLAPRSDGGASVTGYRIESSTDGNAWTVLRANTNSSSRNLLPHQSFAREHVALPRVRSERGRCGPRIGHCTRHHGRHGAQSAHRPVGKRGRAIANRPIVDSAVQ